MMTEQCGRCANLSGLCAMVGCGGFVEKAPLEAVEEIDNSTQQTNGAEPTEISADIMEEHMRGWV